MINIKTGKGSGNRLLTVMRDNNGSQGLRDLCADIREYFGTSNIVLVEIGSYMGESAEIFAQELPNATIYCVDPWEGNFDKNDSCSEADYVEVEQQFDLRTSKYSNIVKLKDYSINIQIPCDVVYIDGRHFYEGVREDILHWLPLVKTAICGHDFLKKPSPASHINGVQKAVREILGEPNKIFSDTSWLKWIQ